MRNRLGRLGQRWPWFGVALRVNDRYGDINGSFVASAVTLAAFISIFPLLLVGIAVLGFVSAGSSHLASDAIRFDEYELQIREEYAHVPEKFFRIGRARILKQFLARPRIYLTSCFSERFEPRARENIARSLRRLGQ